MIILSNSLTGAADEGSLKLASNLVARIKKENKYTCIISFEREYTGSDIHMELNKFHLSMDLLRLLRQKKESLLYIPFPAPMLSMTLRIFLLSLFARYGFRVILTRQYPLRRLARLLLQYSKAELVAFSHQAYDYYSGIVGERVLPLKTGVDTEKYRPVSPERAKELKKNYGFDPDRPLVLHVGHMKQGRNVAALMEISADYQVLLVISTLAKERQDAQLRKRLEEKENIRIIDRYLPNIEEIYQMCDVYFFPVQQAGHCIDVPLSCLEAASCGKPVLTTDFGEMKVFRGKRGFYFPEELTAECVNTQIAQALRLPKDDIRQQVLDYDWQHSIGELTKHMK